MKLSELPIVELSKNLKGQDMSDLMTDEEWKFYEPFLWQVRAPHGRRPVSYRRTLDGIFWIKRTGESWRNLPEKYGKWMAVYQQYRRWTTAGLWEKIESALRMEEP